MYFRVCGFLAFHGLLHLRIALSLLVLGGGWRIDDGRIHDAPAAYDLTSAFQSFDDALKHRLPQPAVLQDPPEFQQRRGVRRAFLQEIDAHELSHGVAIIKGILYPFVRQVESTLQQVHPQHLFYPLRWTASLALVIKWLNQTYPFFPGNDFIHGVQELFAPGDPASAAIFNIAERLLIHDEHLVLSFVRRIHFIMKRYKWAN